jgi:hypothetical protein
MVVEKASADCMPGWLPIDAWPAFPARIVIEPDDATGDVAR